MAIFRVARCRAKSIRRGLPFSSLNGSWMLTASGVRPGTRASTRLANVHSYGVSTVSSARCSSNQSAQLCTGGTYRPKRAVCAMLTAMVKVATQLYGEIERPALPLVRQAGKRLHLVQGSPWKEALAAYLAGGGFTEGD